MLNKAQPFHTIHAQHAIEGGNQALLLALQFKSHRGMRRSNDGEAIGEGNKPRMLRQIISGRLAPRICQHGGINGSFTQVEFAHHLRQQRLHPPHVRPHGQ